jgi:hypothetical protein
MKKKTNVALFLVVLGFGVLLGGCAGIPTVKQPDVVAESPVVSIKGMVSVSGDKIFILKDYISTEITSRKVDLKQYDGQSVEVTGEFSGTTLYVDEVN